MGKTSKSKRMKKALIGAVSLLAVAAMTPTIAQGHQQEQVSINLPAAPLDRALLVLGDTLDMNIITREKLIAGKNAPALSGIMSAQEAINKILAGTGLRATRNENGDYVVSAQTATSISSDSDDDLENEDRPIEEIVIREEIFVFGQKSLKSYFDVTTSVSVTTGEQIEREPLADLYDIITRVPNVNRQSQNGIGFAIRGVQDIGPARAGTGPLLTVFVDDAPLNGPGAGLGPTGAWDLEQVEVYRGPQSTNFGRNSLAGAIYLRTKDPAYDWDLKARAEIGNYGQRWGAIAFGGGIIEDTLAFRVAADYRETQGFTFNPLLDTFNDRTEVWNTRFKLQFDPFDDLSIITTTTYSENLSGTPAVPLPPQVNGEVQDPSDAVREAPTNVRSFLKTESFLQSVNVNWDVSDKVSIQSISTYQATDFTSENDGDLSPENNNFSGNINENKTLTQEVRLNYERDDLNVSLGGFYSNIKSEGDTTLSVSLSAFLGLPFPLFTNQLGDNEGDRDNYAFFLDGEYDFTDSLSLLFGFRYDDESFTNTNIASSSLTPSPLPPGLPPFVLAVLGSLERAGEPETRTGSYNAALPKFGVRWQPNDDFNIAFVAQRAYRAGGAQVNPDNASELIPFDPEYLWNYELSSRASFLDGRLTWNNNVFYSRWTDMQVRVFSEGALGAIGFGFTDNAGKAQLFGAETELNFRINSEFTTYFSAGYSYTEFLDFVNARFDPTLPLDPQNSPNYNGNRFNSAPEFSFNGGFDYNGANGIFGGMDFSYQSDSFNSPFNVPDNFTGEVLLFNARIGYEINENIRVSAVGRNLFDTDYFFQAFRGPDGGSGQLGDPLTWAIRLDVTF